MRFVRNDPHPTLTFSGGGWEDQSPVPTAPAHREYVHKLALSELLLAGMRPTGENSFVIHAPGPRPHDFSVSEGGDCCPLPFLFAGTVLQAFPRCRTPPMTYRSGAV